MTPYVTTFDHHFRQWVTAACHSWGYSSPKEGFYQQVRQRLTDEIASWIGYAVEAGLILEQGLQFNLVNNPAGKGPYRWFSERSNAAEPQCNWEYYVQVAFFGRLWEPCTAAQLQLSFEDELMDLAVRHDGKLVWCIEVKEKMSQLDRLLASLTSYGAGADVQMPDRGNDPLRKAKYLVKHRPEFFTGVAIGAERNFRVQYQGSKAFTFVEANPPLEALRQPP